MTSFTSIVLKACLSDSETRKRIHKIIRENDIASRASEIRKLCVEQFRHRREGLPKMQAVVLEEVLTSTHWGSVAEELTRHFSMIDTSVEPPPSKTTSVARERPTTVEKKDGKDPILL